MLNRFGWFEGFSTAYRVYRRRGWRGVPQQERLVERRAPVMPEGEPRRYSGFGLVRRAAEFVAGYRLAVAGIVVLALVLATITAAEPLIMKRLFDELGAHGASRAFVVTIGALVALELLRAGFNAVLSIRTWDVRIGVEYGVRERVVRKLNTLPISYHQQEQVGGLMNKMNQGITGFITAFGELTFNALPNFAYLVLALLAMTRLDWRLSLVVLVFTPMPALIGALAAREQTTRERRLFELWTRIYSRFNEVLAGILTVKGFAREQAEEDRFLSGVREGNTVVRRGVRTDARTDLLRGLAATLARLAALGLGGWLVAGGQITIGTLIAFLGYISGLFGPVQGLTNIYQTIRRATVSLEAIFSILDAEDNAADATDATEVTALRGEVQFERVGFAYQPGAAPVLEQFDLTVRPGETIALVGPSGAGKSTLMTLLQRLNPVSTGVIRVDGTDIRRVTQTSLRRQIGVVFQDVHLFRDTVRANIGYGRPDATQEEIEAAARAANAHDFIMALPQGYETDVGERGGRLSGGQRQRIAIARALLKDPAILILDEATSALDSESEALIQDALWKLMQNRTAIVI
ncbi:MAG TPA: ABC transporter ATP-binding protein, partial [Gemmatimonadales bacterium]|nr:ABC transporter ATP-binding protein [Gemmatimonadales bacterium]